MSQGQVPENKSDTAREGISRSDKSLVIVVFTRGDWSRRLVARTAHMSHTRGQPNLKAQVSVTSLTNDENGLSSRKDLGTGTRRRNVVFLSGFR